jgi:hypothetical protein
VVLAFVGLKMILAHTSWRIDTLVALGAIGMILATSVVGSLLFPKRAPQSGAHGDSRELPDTGAAPNNTDVGHHSAKAPPR